MILAHSEKTAVSQAITEHILRKQSSTVTQYIDITQLKLAAKNVIVTQANIRKNNTSGKQKQEFQQALQNQDIQKLLTLSKQLSAAQFKNEEMYNALLKFQETLDSFLGRTINTTYVLDDGNLAFIDKISDYYGTATKQKNFNINTNQIIADVKSHKIQTLEDTKSQNRIIQLVQKRQLQYKTYYQESLIRANESDKQWVYWHQNHNKRRTYGYIKNRGVWSEAYVEDIFSFQEQLLTEQEQWIQHVWEQHVKNVTWTASIVEADISDGILASHQTSVKSFQAHSESFNPYYKLAREILTWPNATETMVYDYLRKRQSDRLVAGVGSKYIDSLDSIAEQFDKEVFYLNN